MDAWAWATQSDASGAGRARNPPRAGQGELPSRWSRRWELLPAGGRVHLGQAIRRLQGQVGPGPAQARMGIDAGRCWRRREAAMRCPNCCPCLGDFDHVIVRARIDGWDYWLDGTSMATRLPNIGNVPPFHYALPLRPGGEADLMAMSQRDKAVPDMRMDVTVDHSAGSTCRSCSRWRSRYPGRPGPRRDHGGCQRP